jgi:predicted metal-binding protein
MAMWIIYTDPHHPHIPLEIGYRVIKSARICHDYDRITGYCRDGCPDYGSGGCPPHAPAIAEAAQKNPHAILIYARFLSRFKPVEIARDDFSVQDNVLSNFLNQLGYAVMADYKDYLFFMTCGHCQGCGEEACSYILGEENCRHPQRRAYSVAGTGIDVTATLKDVFDITLQWNRGEKQAEYIIKVIGLLSQEAGMPTMIGQQLIAVINRLECIKWPVGSPEARCFLKAAQIEED